MNDPIEAAIAQRELALQREYGLIQSLQDRIETAKSKAEEAKREVSAAEEAAKLLAEYADERQAHVLEVIQTIASQGLSQVFDEDIELRIEQVVRARRVEMDVKINTGELETSVMDARGGGVAAVAGFLLRACVLLLKPQVRRILVLDEVFAHLSEEYLERMAQFIRQLCEETGLQILLVTHQSEFAQAAHKVFRIEKTSTNTSRFVEE